MNKGRLQIERVVGNNVVLTVSPDNGKEYVLFGKGIGFNAKPGQYLDKSDERIEKRYRLDDEVPLQQFRDLVDEVDPDCLQIAEQVIDRIKERIGMPIHPKVYFALPNHIQFAVYRLRKGMDIRYPFLMETKRDYPVEYEIAEEAAALIAAKFGIQVPVDEVGFLTLHVRSAEGPVSAEPRN
ncbi:PRD domain-containing protein [Paenibacillus kobensis]|uniref:PRD domain-containing protein n=1 Tax=Paenibacillus kobensis TaxID=59841 RepID=UPI0013E346EC|nr:PRD domain-containing protein [Paenibacillus kobensis]